MGNKITLNSDYQLQPGSRTAAMITIQQLKAICEQYKADHKAELEDDYDNYDTDWDGYAIASFEPWRDPIMKADMMCMYDNENIVDDDPQEYCGFHTLDNGFTYYGWIAAGDGDWGCFNLIYFDGDNLRFYQPVIGNNINPKYHSVAGFEGEYPYKGKCFDVDDKDSGDAFYAKYGADPYEENFNWEAMMNDIRQTITVRERDLGEER